MKRAEPASGLARPKIPGWAAGAVIVFAVAAVYGRSLNAPFIFDDVDGIENNESIVSLWPLVGTGGQPGPLNPPTDLPSSGRPLVNLSLAMNYHWGGLKSGGYHVFNVTVHALVALLLWAIVRRTLRLSYFAGRFDARAGWLALAVALIWAVHPLQTEAVVYTTQRSELMVAWCYLATLYCSLRYWADDAEPMQRRMWVSLAVAASFAGMACKEMMVTAPLMVLLFERAYVAGSLRSALRRSWALYVGLASSWLLLVALNAHSPRGESAGFGLGTPLVSWWMTQAQVLWMYLKLVVWPAPLLIHYRMAYLETFAQAWMYVIPVFALLVFTLVLLWRNHPVGFLLAWLLVVLSPTSLVPILTEIAAERRMYLPLASIVALVVVGGYWLAGFALKRLGGAFPSPRWMALVPMCLIAIGLAFVSANRLRAYDDPVLLWRQVVNAQPQNALAHSSLGGLYARMGRLTEGIDELETAVALDPHDHTALANLGQALTDSGQFDRAIERLTVALDRAPDDPLALNNLGVALIRVGRFQAAIESLEHCVRVRPRFATAHNNLGGALAQAGKKGEAIAHFRQSLALDPSLDMARQNLIALGADSGATTEPTR